MPNDKETVGDQSKSGMKWWQKVILSLLGFSIGVALAQFLGSHKPKPTPPRPAQRISVVGRALQGDHLLRQVASNNTISGSMHGSYFLFMGGLSGSVTTSYKVTFAWQGNDGSYRYTTLPLEMIRIVPNKNIGQPFVKFRWRVCTDGSVDVTDCILYAVIGVNPKDWPEEIEMPLGK